MMLKNKKLMKIKRMEEIFIGNFSRVFKGEPTLIVYHYRRYTPSDRFLEGVIIQVAAGIRDFTE